MKKTLILVAVLAMASATAWANCGQCPADKDAAKGAAKGACCKAGDSVFACASGRSQGRQVLEVRSGSHGYEGFGHEGRRGHFVPLRSGLQVHDQG